MRPSGVHRLRRLVPFVLLHLLAGCWWYGFAGGGLPDHIRTVAIIPFENLTTSPDLQIELTNELEEEVGRWLHLRAASEDRADAVIRGTLRRYETDIPMALAADRQQATGGRRRLEIALDIAIVDQTTGKTLWERNGLVVTGEYDESREIEGRRQALEEIATALVEGAQSQW